MTATSDAIQRLEENEFRFDDFVNSLGTYSTRYGISVETIRSFIERKDNELRAFNNRGDWITGTIYSLKDIVKTSGTWYVCVEAHTSSALFITDSVKWRVFQGITSADLPDGGTIDQYLTEGYKVINVDHPPYYGNLVAAWNAVEATGKVVLLLGKRDYSVFGIGANSKPNLRIVGSGVPKYDNANNKLLQNSGTVLQGPIYNQAAGFAIFNLGIDYGDWVRVNLASGQYNDAFSNINVGENANIEYGNLIVLQSDVVPGNSASNTHCILNQTGTGFKQSGVVEVIGGYHGHVIKVYDFVGDTTIAKYQTADGMIIKQDAGSACGRVNVKKLIINGDDSKGSAGLLLEAQSSSLSSVNIGSIAAYKCDYIVAEAAATDSPIVDVVIGEIIGGGITGLRGAAQAVAIGSYSVGFQIGRHLLNACVNGGVWVKSGAANIDIGDGYSKSSSAGDGYKFDAAARHGKIYAGENAGFGVRNNGNENLNAIDITCLANTLGGISALPTISVTLLSSWTNAGSFGVTRYGNLIRISGVLTAGSIGTYNSWVAVAQLSTAYPVGDEFFSCIGYDSSGTLKLLIGKVTATGELQVYGMGSQAVIGIDMGGSYVCKAQ